MNWKLWLTLFIVIGITGLLLFSDKGREFNQKYLSKYTKVIGDYLSNITGRFKKTEVVNRTLQITMTTSPNALKTIEFDLSEKAFDAGVIYEIVYVGDQNIMVKGNDEIDFSTDSMTGTVSFDDSGKMSISGNTPSVELNGILFASRTGEEKIEFDLIGTPMRFSLNDVANDRMIITGVSGLLRISDWSSPLTIKETDNLAISYFKGDITQDGDTLTISGNVEKISLNGVDLSLKKQ